MPSSGLSGQDRNTNLSWEHCWLEMEPSLVFHWDKTNSLGYHFNDKKNDFQTLELYWWSSVKGKTFLRQTRVVKVMLIRLTSIVFVAQIHCRHKTLTPTNKKNGQRGSTDKCKELTSSKNFCYFSAKLLISSAPGGVSHPFSLFQGKLFFPFLLEVNPQAFFPGRLTPSCSVMAYLAGSLVPLLFGPFKSACWTRPVKLAICCSIAFIRSLQKH